MQSLSISTRPIAMPALTMALRALVSYLTAGMFEGHDKSRFDVTALSIGADDNSEMRQRLKASFEHFIDAKTYADDQLAKLIKELEIDILVDLMGFTESS